VFTDIRLEEAINDPAKRKIAWLIESPAFLDKDRIVSLSKYFDIILTHNRELVERGYPFKFYPLGGSWINYWKIYGEKTKLVSAIFSDKDLTKGHKLRHEIAERFRSKIDLYGTGYKPINNKITGLADYAFSVVVENAREDWYFTEKLIDCFSCGTIPIYWGCPDIGRFFDIRGMRIFEDISELEFVLGGLDMDLYQQINQRSIISNFHTAMDYQCCEDWVFTRYPELFEGE
jgi:hypothetical protein